MPVGIILTTPVTMKNFPSKHAIAAATILQKMFEKVRQTPEVVQVIDDWGERFGDTFLLDDKQRNPAFKVIDEGFDFAWGYFPVPGYKTAWICHRSGKTIKVGLSSKLKSPLAHGRCEPWTL